MTAYFVSLLMCVAVGLAYALVQIRSPAPPLVALVGLLGILQGEQSVGAGDGGLFQDAVGEARTVLPDINW